MILQIHTIHTELAKFFDHAKGTVMPRPHSPGNDIWGAFVADQDLDLGVLMTNQGNNLSG